MWAVRLAFHKFEPEKENDKQPVFILHGLFGKKTNWYSLADSLCKETDRRVYVVDARNHGDSPHVPIMDYPSMSDDLQLLMRHEGITKPALVGHSMGGRIAMTLALTKVSDGVKVSMGGRIAMTLAFTKVSDEVKVRHLAQAIPSSKLMEVAAVTEAVVRSVLLNNIAEDESNNSFRWVCSLDDIGRNMKHLMRFISYNRSYHSDALFLAGANSTYFTKADYPEVQRLFPRADMLYIEGAGHWLHLDKPRELLDALVPFMNKPSSL
ncbi:PREDICTED: alpha/beta hydrolase domain-containing protein 11-like [Priapulus caudatus]|uniref:sn-1-specific diacylglycerol lipase ABHD11 n=1 Tax=Priapulus caudatus TaxID=37621 RepID=A0ABM1EXW3_PRICU|nr:PREDICTED: alpha/beta hydrolase domain-containing protein 11-like [Priapulus caudatus]